MAIVTGTPGVDDLCAAEGALREWQSDRAGIQLHPGDLGWFWRFGAEATAAAVRTWTRDGRILAVGLLDGPGLLRMTIAPDSRHDDELARHIVFRRECAGARRPATGEGVRRGAQGRTGPGSARRGRLAHRRAVDAAVPRPQRAGPRPRSADRAGRAGHGARADRRAPGVVPPLVVHRRALAHDGGRGAVRRRPVPGRVRRPGQRGGGSHRVVGRSGEAGLLEPVGVHRDHRGHGHGTAISLAAAAALRELGSSSAMVCTPSSNAGAVATYRSAGFQPLPEVRDRRRDV